MTKSCNGNVLFLILIAVALFAALSYAVTSSTRNSNTNISEDEANLQASAILNYTSALRAAILRMQISNGCQDDQFNFSNALYKFNNDTLATEVNANSPSDGRCDVFSPQGGNLSPLILSPKAWGASNPAANAIRPGHGRVNISQILNVGTDDVAGTVTANDILIGFSYINKDVCLKINDMMDVENPSGDAPPDTFSGGVQGVYTNGSLTSARIYNDVNIAGKQAFCTKSPTAPYYYFYKIVLRAR